MTKWMRVYPAWNICVCALLSVLIVSAPNRICSAEENARTIVQWRFQEAGELRGWSASGHIENARVERGALRGRAVEWDPILMGPVFEVKTSPLQFVEIRMRSAQAGKAELFWTETVEGKYGGFSQQKCSRFSVSNSEEFRSYGVYPFWHAKDKIIRLRLDVPAGGTFAVQSIAIREATGARTTQATEWSAADGLKNWTSMQQSEPLDVTAEGLHFTSSGYRPILLSPPLQMDGRQRPIVTLRMAVSAGKRGRIYAVNERMVGWEDLAFELRADGRMHTYNIDMGGIRGWQGNVVLLGLQPTDIPEARVTIASVSISADARGPSDVGVDYFGQMEGVNRRGRPARIVCRARNFGGRVADGVRARLETPRGVDIIGESEKLFESISLHGAERLSWTIRSDQVGTFPIKVRLAADGKGPIVAESEVEFTAPPRVEATGRVPRPRPVRSAIDVGAFYFPGWHGPSRWAPILDFPRRRPVLGWYDEANSECADWQIKWAVEHGITFFMVDWYWDRGNRQLEHWLHEAYADSRYKSYLKWAIMWANHNRPGSHSRDDWKKVTRYWIEHYLKSEEYYRINGRPAVFIWSPGNIRRDVGGSEAAAELYAMSQRMARDAGLPGIFFVAMSSHQSKNQCLGLKAEGYEAFTSYHAFQRAEHELGTQSFSFEEVVRTAPEVWRDADQRSSELDYYPIVDTGWSSEPWHRQNARVIYGRTPERFGRLCRSARKYAEKREKSIVCLGPWNEWGEGSYIEPCAEYGFEHLEALREAFCPAQDYPPQIIPADVGRGPYDFDFSMDKTSWTFDDSCPSNGWTPNDAVQIKIADGQLEGRTSGPDPILAGPAVRIDTQEVHALSVRIRSRRAMRSRFYWGITTLRPSGMTSLGFQVPGGNEWTDLRFDLSECPAWRGVVVSVRLDPASGAGHHFAIDHIRLE